MHINRPLFFITAFIAAALLSGVIFGAFFRHDARTHARAFVVVAPRDAAGAAGADAMTQTAVALASTDVYRAALINDLTLSGTPFTQEDIGATHVARVTPELVRIDVLTKSPQATRIATSGAYGVVRTLQTYYDTASYTFTVIDGTVVPQHARFSHGAGIALSMLIGTLITTMVFSLVSVTVGSLQHTAARAHGTIHASHARLDLKHPGVATTTAEPMPASIQTEDYDYMREMYRDYDQSLESLTQENMSTPPQETPTEPEATLPEEMTESTAETSEPPQDNDESAYTEKPAQQANTAAPARVATQDIQKRIVAHKDALTQKARDARDAVGAFFRRDTDDKKASAETPTEKLAAPKAAPPANLPVAQSAAPHITTHSAPANLPVMEESAQDTDAASDDAAHKEPPAEPTPAEVRKRLNELLRGKAPKISDDA